MRRAGKRNFMRKELLEQKRRLGEAQCVSSINLCPLLEESQAPGKAVPAQATKGGRAVTVGAEQNDKD